MTTFVRFSALKAITACVGFTLTASLALAGDGTVPADQIGAKLDWPVSRLLQ